MFTVTVTLVARVGLPLFQEYLNMKLFLQTIRIGLRFVSITETALK